MDTKEKEQKIQKKDKRTIEEKKNEQEKAVKKRIRKTIQKSKKSKKITSYTLLDHLIISFLYHQVTFTSTTTHLKHYNTLQRLIQRHLLQRLYTIMDYAHYLALYYLITEGSYPRDMHDNKLKRRLRNKATRYLPYRGRLFIKNKDGSYGQEVLHSGNVMDVIAKVHKEGHMGINNTWRRMRLQYEGYQLYDRVREYVEACEQCQLRARRRHVRQEESHPIPTPTRPFYMIGCDAVGPINPPSKNGNRYLLVAVDYLTRWPVVAAVPNINEQITAAFLFNCIVKDFGVPSYILTDRGANFKSDYVHTFLKWMGCKPLTTTAFRPQVNGLCERMNQTIVEVLSKICQDQDMLDRWDECLTHAILAIRSTPNDATRYSPAMLLYGYDIRTPATWPEPRQDFVEGELADEVVSRIKVIDSIMQQHREVSRQRTQRKQQSRKQRYDDKVVQKRFAIGDQVLMLDKHKPHKLANRWIGPMIVVRVNNHGTYWLQGPGGKRLDGAVNGDMLKAWRSRDKLIPDVVAQRADRQLHAYIERVQPGI